MTDSYAGMCNGYETPRPQELTLHSSASLPHITAVIYAALGRHT